MRPRRSVTRTDSFFNALGKLGGNYDKRAGARFVAGTLLDIVTLDNLYHFNDLASTICDTYPDSAMRAGFNVTIPDDLDTTSVVKNRIDELDVTQLVRQASVWGRVFGDACVMLGVDDGATVDKPLDFARIRRIKFLAVYDRRDFTIESYYANPLEQKFNTPEYYTMIRVNPIRGVLDPSVAATYTAGVRMHESRLVWFKGANTSRQKLAENAGWHHSILQKPYEVVRDFEMTWAGAAHLMQEASQGVYKVKGLMEILASEAGADGLQRRFQAIDEGRSVARSIVVDADGEEYTRQTTTFTGVPDMLDRFAGRLSAAARIPVTRLMGEAPAGLNATGAGDTRSFYDNVVAWRTAEIEPGLKRILKCVLAESKQGLGEGSTDDDTTHTDESDWSITWPSLYQPTQKEEAEVRKIVADTDSVYIAQGVLDPTEVTLSRFGAAGWSMDTIVDLSLREAIKLTEEDIKPTAPAQVGPEGGSDAESDPEMGATGATGAVGDVPAES